MTLIDIALSDISDALSKDDIINLAFEHNLIDEDTANKLIGKHANLQIGAFDTVDVYVDEDAVLQSISDDRIFNYAENIASNMSKSAKEIYFSSDFSKYDFIKDIKDILNKKAGPVYTKDDLKSELNDLVDNYLI